MNKNPSRVFNFALICYIVPWKVSIWMEGNFAARSLASCSRIDEEFVSISYEPALCEIEALANANRFWPLYLNVKKNIYK